MLRTIVAVALLVVICVGCWMIYKRVNGDNGLGNGAVYQSSNEKDQMETGTTYIGDKPIEAHPTPSRSDDPGTINTAPEGDYLNGGNGASGPVTTSQPQPYPDRPYPDRPYSPQGPQPKPYSPDKPYSPEKPYSPRPYGPQQPFPSSDTLTPNPPNGYAYAGSGAYELYRQDDLTFRLDTKTGASCILYATMEEWSKPIVYAHGCGSHWRRARSAR